LEYSAYLQSKNINIVTYYIVCCMVMDKQTSIAATDTHATIELPYARFLRGPRQGSIVSKMQGS
jgi:hypothetical protein